MKSINDWIKPELFMDFHVTGERPVDVEINEYTTFFNEKRPAYALNYLAPHMRLAFDIQPERIAKIKETAGD